MLELLESNRALLHNLTAATGIGDIAKVHDLAATNVTHRVYTLFHFLSQRPAVKGSRRADTRHRQRKKVKSDRKVLSKVVYFVFCLDVSSLYLLFQSLHFL